MGGNVTWGMRECGLCVWLPPFSNQGLCGTSVSVLAVQWYWDNVKQQVRSRFLDDAQ